MNQDDDIQAICQSAGQTSLDESNIKLGSLSESLNKEDRVGKMREIKSQISSLMNKIDCEPNNVTSGMGQSHCSRVLNFDNKENKAKNDHNSNQNAMISEINGEKSGLPGYEGNEGLSPISL